MSNRRDMNTQAPERPDCPPGHALFDGLPVPVCLVDRRGCLVAMNHAARCYWDVDPAAVRGQPALQTLGIVPSGGGEAWNMQGPSRTPCRIMLPAGTVRVASLLHVNLDGVAPPTGAIFIIEGVAADMLGDVPEWALVDPVTGLGNRHRWEREVPRWAARSGSVAILDLDDLKEVNDLHGHVAGDRLLATAGRAIARVAPQDGLAVRYGGDEFVVVRPDADETAAEAWAEGAIRDVASCAAAADLPIVPRLSHGIAGFGPGGLADALRRADDALYVRKGVLLPAASGGRIILTREGRAALRGAGDDREPRPGVFSSGFGPEFDLYLRVQYARAVEDARAFVQLVAPEAGIAAIEVGAGSGRITFDGTLAERIGPTGQLLLTDPSGAQLVAARREAAARGMEWIRFLRAAAERLPVASGTVDLIVGVLFLQFTAPGPALREMARVVRPGGRVAIGAGLPFDWPPAWREILQPVRDELGALGLPLPTLFCDEPSLRGFLADAGLEVERWEIQGPGQLEFPHADIATGFWRQNGLVSLLLHEVPAERRPPVLEAFEARLRRVFADTAPRERTLSARGVHVVARKPG